MHGLGYDPQAGVRARARVTASGLYAVVMKPAGAPRPAVSLARWKLRDLDQGRAGMCWSHSPAALFELTARAQGLDAFPASRRAVAYAAKQMYEGGGNPADGGSPTDAVSVMTSRGVGVAHEALCPYSDDPAVLGTKPDSAIFEDAQKSHLVAPVLVKSLDEIVTLIDAGHPVCNGFDCPDTMQQQGAGLIASCRGFLGGHSVLLIGYALPGILDKSRYRWLQALNWWGHLYRPLPSALAAGVEGYAPSTAAATADCWIREDLYVAACNNLGGGEHVSATGVDGLTGGTVAPAVPGTDFNDALVI